MPWERMDVVGKGRHAVQGLFITIGRNGQAMISRDAAEQWLQPQIAAVDFLWDAETCRLGFLLLTAATDRHSRPIRSSQGHYGRISIKALFTGLGIALPVYAMRFTATREQYDGRDMLVIDLSALFQKEAAPATGTTTEHNTGGELT